MILRDAPSSGHPPATRHASQTPDTSRPVPGGLPSPGPARRQCAETTGPPPSLAHRQAVARTVHEAIEQLDIPSPWDLGQFISATAVQLGKPIRLRPYTEATPAERPCGMLLCQDTEDIVLYDSATSRYHMEQIILHEVGHIVLSHSTSAVDWIGQETTAQITPDIDPATVRTILGRTTFDDIQEYQAELFASLVLSQRPARTPRSSFISTFLTSWSGGPR